MLYVIIEDKVLVEDIRNVIKDEIFRRIVEKFLLFIDEEIRELLLSRFGVFKV